jgi:hypothetical protein
MVSQTPVLLAEVSDKIPSNWQHVAAGLFLLLTISAFAKCRCLVGMLLEFAILGACLLFLVQGPLFDAAMREAVLQEQGIGYYVVALVSLLLPVVVGIVLYRRGTHRVADGGGTTCG